MSNWPNIGDSIFAAGMDWETNALLGYHGDWFLAYASSYKESGDIIVASVENGVAPDSVSYAVLYLYRHYMELMLKGLIDVGNKLETGVGGFPKGHHRLKDLWNQCRPLLEAAYPEGEKSETDAVEKCLIELHTMDPTGESFRFGEDKRGNPTFSSGPQLNLSNLRDVMKRIGGFLVANYDWMHMLLQEQSDMNSDAY